MHALRFFLDAMRAVEAADTAISQILNGLRNRSITTVTQWQPRYAAALGLVTIASSRAEFIPKGARTGVGRLR